MSDTSFCKLETVSAVLVATLLREKVGEYESPIVRAEVEAAAGAARWRVVLDLSEVQMVASAGLGMLVTLNNAAKKGGGKLALCKLEPTLRQVFEMTKLHRVLTLCDTREQAIKAVL